MDDTQSDLALLLGGRLQLRQPLKGGHRAGTDAVLLAAAAGHPEGLLIDLGAGVGTAGLAVARRCPGLRVLLIEVDGSTAAFARENISLNGLSGQAEVIEADALSSASRRKAGLDGLKADALLTNPPWYAAGQTRISPNADRARAHTGISSQDDPDGLDAWLRAVASLTRPGARVVMILHASQLATLLPACKGRLGALRLMPIHARAEGPAIRLLVSGIRGSRAPLTLLPALVLHEADGSFTERIEAISRGEALLDLG